MTIKTCALCSRKITEQFWICASCERDNGIVGIPYRNWPKWIKEMAMMDRRQRTIDRREIAFSEINEFDMFEYLTKE